mgnify:CR=1 FL=1
MTTKAELEAQADKPEDSKEEPTQGDAILTTETPTREGLLAQLKERDDRLVKLENDLRSRDGQRRKQGETDAILEDIRLEQRAQRKVTSALMDAIAKGETDGLTPKLTAIEQEVDQSRQNQQRKARYDALVSQLSAVITGDDDSLLLSENQATELQKAWTEAGKKGMNTGDFSELHDLVIEASKMTLKNEREKAKKETSRIKDDAKAETKKRLEKAGIHDLDTGASAGAGGGRGEYIRRLKSGEPLPPKEEIDRMTATYLAGR